MQLNKESKVRLVYRYNSVERCLRKTKSWQQKAERLEDGVEESPGLWAHQALGDVTT